MIKNFLSFVSLMAISFNSLSAAYETCNGREQRWLKDKTTLYLNHISFPEGSTYTQQTHDMIDEWNNVKGSNFTFYTGVDNDNTAGLGNGRNEVYFSSFAANTTTLGVTNIRSECYWFFGNHWGYEETDIAINSDKDWTTGSYSGNGASNLISFKSVMLHELGHSLGLKHSNDDIAVMNSYYPNGGTVGYYEETTPLPDDRWGLKILYPDSSVGRDIAVSRFKTNENGGTWVNSYAGTTYKKSGDTISFEYTILNLGTTDESVPIRFYISNNRYISTYDTYVGSTTWTMPGYAQVTASKTIYIPNLTNGTYYIGYLVDSSDNINEENEDNNQVSILKIINISN